MAITANGLTGGKFTELVEVMEIRKARGTLFDHVYIKEYAERLRCRYGIYFASGPPTPLIQGDLDKDKNEFFHSKRVIQCA